MNFISMLYERTYRLAEKLAHCLLIGRAQTKERSATMQTANKMAETVKLESGYSMTDHAWRRMTARGLSRQAVDAAMAYGRTIHARGAEIHALGRREVKKYSSGYLDLHPFEGIQVVCVPGNGVVMTVYRNRDFNGLFKCKPRHGKRLFFKTRSFL
jgi:hypothetical protein